MNPIEATPKMIANHLFSNEPGPIGSIQLTANEDEMDTGFIYEVLLTVVAEGLMMMADNVEDVTRDNISADHIEVLNQWINVLGFNVEVATEEGNPTDYYCNVMLRNSENENYFVFQKLKEDYHFLRSASSVENEPDGLENMKTIIKTDGGFLEFTFTQIENESN